jgi:hypothetical protein
MCDGVDGAKTITVTATTLTGATTSIPIQITTKNGSGGLYGRHDLRQELLRREPRRGGRRYRELRRVGRLGVPLIVSIELSAVDADVLERG